MILCLYGNSVMSRLISDRYWMGWDGMTVYTVDLEGTALLSLAYNLVQLPLVVLQLKIILQCIVHFYRRDIFTIVLLLLTKTMARYICQQPFFQ